VDLVCVNLEVLTSYNYSVQLRQAQLFVYFIKWRFETILVTNSDIFWSDNCVLCTPKLSTMFPWQHPTHYT